MKKILINNASLNFIEKNEGQANTIIFLHGNSHSLRTFSKQMDSALLSNYHLIGIDVPGHGDSSPSDTYSLFSLAETMTAFIKELKLKNVILVGHSLGGHIALNTLAAGLNPKGIFLFGAPPLKNPFTPDAFIPNENATALQKLEASAEEISIFMDEMNYKGEDKITATEDFLKTHADFRQGIYGTIMAGTNEDEINLINNYGGAVTILLATKETFANNEYMQKELGNKNIEFLTIESAHSPHIEAPEAFNAILASFCHDVFSDDPLFAPAFKISNAETVLN